MNVRLLNIRLIKALALAAPYIKATIMVEGF